MKSTQPEKIKLEPNQDFVNWNKYSLADVVKFLEDKYQHEGSWESQCIAILCEWYRFNNFPVEFSRLPLDFEMEEEFHKRKKMAEYSQEEPSFLDGAKWMKTKLLTLNTKN